MRVAVIGAGASGIAAITQLRDRFDVTAYEARSEAGGAWIYDQDPGEGTIEFLDDQAIVREHGKSSSPMYEHLKTNLPHRLMSFRNTPFSAAPLFPDHACVLDYIQALAKQHADVIRYGEKVTRLRKDGSHWRITTDKHEREYDAVVIANGHYAVPSIPWVHGLRKWRRKLLHARFYRNAEQLLALVPPGLLVMVIGNGPSGSDLARELAQAGATVYVSIRTPSKWLDAEFSGGQAWFHRLRLVGTIDSIAEEDLTLADGSVIADVGLLLYATGYAYAMPFASNTDEPFASHPLIENGTAAASVSSLDPSQIFYQPDPTLALLMLQLSVVPFSMGEAQARVIGAIWSGKAKLPIEIGLPDFGRLPGRAKHKLGYPADFEYVDAILKAIGEGHESDTEIDDRGMSATLPWRHQLRRDALQLRREHLGW